MPSCLGMIVWTRRVSDWAQIAAATVGKKDRTFQKKSASVYVTICTSGHYSIFTLLEAATAFTAKLNPIVNSAATKTCNNKENYISIRATKEHYKLAGLCGDSPFITHMSLAFKVPLVRTRSELQSASKRITIVNNHTKCVRKLLDSV